MPDGIPYPCVMYMAGQFPFARDDSGAAIVYIIRMHM